MKIEPRKWRRMDFEDFLIAREGWLEDVLMDILLARKQTFILALTLGQKYSALEKSWPDPVAKKTESSMVNYKGLMVTARQAQIMHQKVKEAKAKKQNG